MKKYSAIIFVLFLYAQALFPQENKPISLNGYLTSMQSVMFDSLSGAFRNENLLHNRLNLKGYAGNSITFSAELRNRLFTGDMVRLGEYYSGLIGADEGLVDMSWNVIEKGIGIEYVIRIPYKSLSPVDPLPSGGQLEIAGM